MNAPLSTANQEVPTLEFRRSPNGAVDTWAFLDCLPGGLQLRVQEELGKNEHLVTIERRGLKVTLVASLFHVDCLALALAEYVREVRKERKYPVLDRETLKRQVRVEPVGEAE